MSVLLMLGRAQSEGFQGPGGVPGVVPVGGGDAGVPGRFQDAMAR